MSELPIIHTILLLCKILNVHKNINSILFLLIGIGCSNLFHFILSLFNSLSTFLSITLHRYEAQYITLKVAFDSKITDAEP